MFRKYILHNPEIIRYFRINFRFPRFASFAAIYILALICLYSLMYFSMSLSKNFEWGNYSKIAYVVTMGIEYMLYFYIGTYLISHSLAQEKEKGTFEFLRLTVIDRRVLAIGKLLGAPVFLTFLILLTFPFVLLFALMAGIPLMHLLMVHFNLIIYGLFFHTLGLFCAVSVGKITSANTLSLSLPLLFTMITLALETRTSSPFYTLFSVIGEFPEIRPSINFYAFYVYSFLIMGMLIIYLTYWFMVGLVRKLDSENNHIFTKKQSAIFLLLSEIIILGFFWDKIISGDIEALIGFYIINLLLILILISILNPTREDFFIYLNKKQARSVSLWYEKSPIFQLIIFFNLLILVITVSVTAASIFLNELGFTPLLIPVFCSVILFLFTYIYSQVFFLINIIFVKNTATLTSILLVISFFIPVPVNFLTRNREDMLDLFIFNPFISFAKLVDDELFTLANLSQFLILVIVLLGLNVWVLSKKEEIQKKYVL